MGNRIAILMMYAFSCCGCSNMLYTGQQKSVMYRADEAHMPEAVRRNVASVDVALDATKPQLRVGGDYGQELMTVGEGTGDGLVKGAQLGLASAASDAHAAILLPFLLPVTIVAGGIVGAAAAKIEIELAEFDRRPGSRRQRRAPGRQAGRQPAGSPGFVIRLSQR